MHSFPEEDFLAEADLVEDFRADLEDGFLFLSNRRVGRCPVFPVVECPWAEDLAEVSV